MWDKTKKIKWNFLNVYGAPHEEDKPEFLTELAMMCSKNSDPYIIGGDFNLVRFSTEKNKAGIHKHSGLFNSVINSFGPIDIHLCGGKYTWSNNCDTPTLERLDRVLVDKNWESLFPTVMTYKLPREVSDHNPIILNDNTPLP